MAKRSCRRTTDENLIHKKAVEMRKKPGNILREIIIITQKTHIHIAWLRGDPRK